MRVKIRVASHRFYTSNGEGHRPHFGVQLLKIPRISQNDTLPAFVCIKKEDRENLRLPEFYVALSDNKLEDKESASDYHKDAKTNHC